MTDLATKVLLNKIEHIGSISLPPLFFIVVLNFVGYGAWLRHPVVKILILIQALMLVAVLTNEWHHLWYVSVSTIGDGWMVSFDAVYGPISIIGTALSFFTMALGIAIALFAFLNADKLHRRQFFLVAMAGAFPAVAAVISIYRILDVPESFSLSLAFMFSAWALFLATFKYELLTIPPVALNKVIESMIDGTVVTDSAGNILYLNPSAERTLGTSLKAAYGKSLGSLAPFLVPGEGKGVDQSVVEIRDPVTSTRFLNVQNTDMSDAWGGRAGKLLILRDVTEERQTKEALRTANGKLRLLSSVTRHDIMNKISVIRGFNELISMRTEGAKDLASYSDRIEEASGAIEQFVTFTKEYQNLGVEAPEWQNLRVVFDRARALGSKEGIEYHCDAKGVEIYADPMLERFFYILLDNTIHHGGQVSSISLAARGQGDKLIISYEDDGVGVPDDLKERIFEIGFGHNTGLGLYLGKQILSITDIEIKESGKEGEGARFEILVPQEGWRRSSCQ